MKRSLLVEGDVPVGVVTRTCTVPADWEGEVTAEGVQRAAGEGAFGRRTEMIVKAFPGRPRATMLSGIAVLHCSTHMGEAATVRAAGGFGTGI